MALIGTGVLPCDIASEFNTANLLNASSLKMDNRKLVPFSQSVGIPLSDGVPISGIPVMEQAEPLLARQARPMMEPSTNYFVYAPSVTMHNRILDYNYGYVPGGAQNYQQRYYPRDEDTDFFRHSTRDDRQGYYTRDADTDFYRPPTRGDQRWYPRDVDRYCYHQPAIEHPEIFYLRYAVIGCNHEPSRVRRCRTETRYPDCVYIHEHETRYPSCLRYAQDGPSGHHHHRNPDLDIDYARYPQARCHQEQFKRTGDLVVPGDNPLENNQNHHGKATNELDSQPEHPVCSTEKNQDHCDVVPIDHSDSHTGENPVLPQETRENDDVLTDEPGSNTGEDPDHAPQSSQNDEPGSHTGEHPVSLPGTSSDHCDGVPIGHSDSQTGENSVLPQDTIQNDDVLTDEPGSHTEEDPDHSPHTSQNDESGSHTGEHPVSLPETSSDHDDDSPTGKPNSQTEENPEDSTEGNNAAHNVPVEHPDSEAAETHMNPDEIEKSDEPNGTGETSDVPDETDVPVENLPHPEVSQKRSSKLGSFFRNMFSSRAGKKTSSRKTTEESFADDGSSKGQDVSAKEQEEALGTAKEEAKEEKMRKQKADQLKDARKKEALDLKDKPEKKSKKPASPVNKKMKETKAKFDEATKKAKEKFKSGVAAAKKKVAKLKNPFKKKK